MVKILISILFLYSFVFASDIFQTNCLSCHKDQDELKLFMSKYTLKYSSESRIKKALFKFLRNPTSNKSIMSSIFIMQNGFKTDSALNDKQLKEAIDKYYQLFNIKSLIK